MCSDFWLPGFQNFERGRRRTTADARLYNRRWRFLSSCSRARTSRVERRKQKGTELTPSTHPDAVSCRLEAFQSRLASPPRTSVVIVHRHRFSESPRTPCLRASARVLREKSQPTCPNLRVRWLLRRAGERLRPPGIELPLASARASFVVLFGWCTVCAVPCFYFSFSFLPFVFYSAAFFDGVIVPLFLGVLSCGVW